MRKFLLAIFLLITATTQAKTYYVSATGDNAKDGLSPATAWQSIAKVNSFNFAANDYILFNRDDVFFGGIVVKRSNINFGAYGSGAKPVITGLVNVSGWVNLGGNIWEAPVSASVKSGVNLVLRNNIPQQVGRYPNADASNGGYLVYTKSTSSSITGPALSSTRNWTGAEIAIRMNRWDIIRQRVTSHSGGVVNFTDNRLVPRTGYGYFFQRDSRTLDQDGEWWHNASADKLRMYFSNNNPNSYNIQISAVDTLLKFFNSELTVSDLAFTGSGKKGIFTNGGSGITIKNCDVTNSGADAITAWFTADVTVDNCTATNNLGSGIRVYHTGASPVNLVVKNCTVTNTAYMAGMETSNENNGGAGIAVTGGNGLTVQNNKITNCGYVGIAWQGDNVYIKYNFINRFCTLRDDGGGIYTVEHGGSGLPTRYNRNIISNIILNGIGNNDGTPDKKSASSKGLYFDLGTRTVRADSNTVAYTVGGAFHGNNNSSLTITNNVFFGNGKSSSLQRFADAAPVRNMIITKNIMYPYRFEYRNLGINSPSMTKEADIKAMGTLDNNYYSIKSIGSGKDTSIIAVTTNADNSNFQDDYNAFSYLTNTVGIEKSSTEVAGNGTLEYNASSSPRVVSFTGTSKKDALGNVFDNSVIIAPWSSKVLIANGSADITNKAPVVNAGSALTIALPINTVTLNGSAIDQDGTITKYSWAKISGPASGTISTPLDDITVLLDLTEGVYQYQLTATDNDGATGRDTVRVTVNSLLAVDLLPAVNPANTVNGLDYKYYHGDWNVLPSFPSLTPVKTGTISNFSLDPAERGTQFGFEFTGYINVPADGVYTFFTTSDDGSKLYIDDVLIVSNDGIHGPSEKSGVIGLKAGKHAITCVFFEQIGGQILNVKYQSDNISKRAIPNSALYRDNGAANRTVNTSNMSISGGASNLSIDNGHNIAESKVLKISSYPNPSSNEFGLSVQGGNNEKVAVTVMDIAGKIAFQTLGTTNKIYKFGNAFRPGVYIVRVIQGSTVQTLKVIKL